MEGAEVAAPADRPRGGRALRPVRTFAAIVAGVLAVVGCTEDADPSPPPDPTPEAAITPSPSGVRVAVVLPEDDVASAEIEHGREALDQLAEDRTGDVAALRTVVADESVFQPDLAALLADDGHDLVCIIGQDGARTALELGDRFPATRFCAVGTPREEQPVNVDLFDVAFEELGHVLGVVAAEVAGDDGEVALVRADDRRDRARRRAGLVAGIGDTAVTVDRRASDRSDPRGLVEELEDAGPDVTFVDAAGTVGRAVAEDAPGALIVPSMLAEDEAVAARAIATYELRPDVIVDAAVDRWLDEDDRGDVLGFADGVFVVELADAVPEAAAAYEDAVAALVAGEGDPIGTPLSEDGEDADEGDG
jgi:hypothetical protein